jgi:hypothetical protein
MLNDYLTSIRSHANIQKHKHPTCFNMTSSSGSESWLQQYCSNHNIAVMSTLNNITTPLSNLFRMFARYSSIQDVISVTFVACSEKWKWIKQNSLPSCRYMICNIMCKSRTKYPVTLITNVRLRCITRVENFRQSTSPFPSTLVVFHWIEEM